MPLNLFFTKRLALAFIFMSLFFVLAYIVPEVFLLAKAVFVLFMAYCIYECLVLFATDGIDAHRNCPKRLSNGDENLIQISIDNLYKFPVRLKIIDELPEQFQKRDAQWSRKCQENEVTHISYVLRPLKRGVYSFGALRVYSSCFLCLFERRYTFNQDTEIPVYPSFIHLRRYELLAFGNERRPGKVVLNKKLGHGMEFEQIKDYIQGDPQRWINWKASARRNKLMVNQYTDEFAKDIWCFVDKGRLMKMPFEGLSLLDYAINSTLAVSHIAIKAGDRAGLITFSNKLSSVIEPSKRSIQMNRIMETLYAQRTYYLDANYELLTTYIKSKIRRRSLILLYTNFETLHAFRRQLRLFRRIAAMHLLVVLFFENTEVTDVIRFSASSLKDIYMKSVAEEMNKQKQLMIKELAASGIIAVCVKPEQLSMKVINKYLEIKARGID